MALDPLATVADLEARGMTVGPSEAAIVAVYLNVASTAVREAAGTAISRITSTITLPGVDSSWLRLPGLPIASVATVTIDDDAVTDWRLRSGHLWRAAGWTSYDGPSEVEITYTYGLTEVPADIVDLVCRMTASAVKAFRDQEDGMAPGADRIVTSERLGDWAVTYGNDGRITEMELTQHWRERLAARFGGGMGMARSR